MATEQTNAATRYPGADEPTAAEELDLHDALRRELALIESERLMPDVPWLPAVPPDGK